MAPRDSSPPSDDPFGLELVVICAGVTAVVCASVPRLLAGWGGLLLLGGMLLSGLLAFMEAVQRGQNRVRALTNVLAVAALAFGIVSVPIWVLVGFPTGASLFQVDETAPQQPTAPAAADLVASLPPTVIPQAMAIPTAAPAPAPVPTAPAMSSACGQAIVSGVEALALRSAPGMSSQVIGSGRGGTTVELLCDAPVAVDGITWRHVRSGDTQGWMSAGFLKPLATQGE